MSSFHTHPGGTLIFSHAGHDATGVFGGFHPSSAWDGLDRFLIGNLDAKPTSLEEDFRRLRATVRSMGLHKARYGRTMRCCDFVACRSFCGFCTGTHAAYAMFITISYDALKYLSQNVLVDQFYGMRTSCLFWSLTLAASHSAVLC